MSRKVIVCGATNFGPNQIAVCEFWDGDPPPPPPQLPLGNSFNPGLGGDCTVDLEGTIAVVGNVNLPELRLVDVSDPANPQLLGMTSLTTISSCYSVAIHGTLVAAGEMVAQRIALVLISDLMHPTPIGMIFQGMIGTDIGSLAFVDDHVVVAAGANSSDFLKVNFTNIQSPQGQTAPSTLPFPLTLDADPDSHTIAVASPMSNLVVLFDEQLNLIGSLDSGLPGIASVAVKGKVVLVNSNHDSRFSLIDFSPPLTVWTSTSFNNNLGVATVAFDGQFGAFGPKLGSPGLTFFDLRKVIAGTAGAQPQLIGQLGGLVPGQIPSMKMQTLPVLLAARIKADPTSLDFGDVLLGQSSDRTVQISNPGNDQLRLSAIQTSDAQHFQPLNFTAPAMLTIAPNTSAPLTVRFLPGMTVGLVTGSLTMTTNVKGMQNFAVPLFGTGDMQVPAIAANPTSLDFGTVPILTQAPTLTVQIINNGSAPLNVDTIQTSDSHFTASTGALPAIAPKASAPLMVTYNTPDVGQFNADLSMRTNDPNNRTFHVPLSATGVTGPSTIMGHVYDAATLLPIPKATVVVGSTQLTANDAGNDAGFYTLPVNPGIYDVYAEVSGYTPMRDTVTVPALTQWTEDFKLMQPVDFTVEGLVTAKQTGLPIPGATVRLSSLAPIPAIITTMTKPTGMYKIVENPGSWDGAYSLDVWATGYYGMSDGFDQIQSGSDNPRSYMLIKMGVVTGQVTDMSRSPISDALVMVGTGIPMVGLPRTFQFYSSTDSSGRYSIAVDPPGSYNVVAVQDYYEDSDPVPVVVMPDTVSPASFVLVKAGRGSLSGVVTDSDTQQGIDSATVEASVEDPVSESKSTETNPDGTYTLTQVLSGRRQVQASAVQYSSMTQTVRVIAGQTVPVPPFALKPVPPR
jgi:hypothetical protein